MNAIPPKTMTVAEADRTTSKPNLTPRPAVSPKTKPRRRKRTLVPWSLALCVGLPTLLALLHYTLIAADQYVAEAKFAVRGSEAAATDMLGVLTGVPGHAASTGDALIVQDYIRSRDVIEEMGRRLDLRAIFARPEADWLASLDPADPIEDVVKYWRGMAEVNFDSLSGITTLRVAAFRPDDAVAVAASVLEAGEVLVNSLSERARQDAVSFAESQLADAEKRLVDARSTLTDFRDRRQAIDPTRTAEARLQIMSGLEGELAKSQAELSALKSYMRANAPGVVSLENRIAALQRQISTERAKLAGDPAQAEVMSGLVADYERLMVEREFAEKAYVSALGSLEGARAEALRKQRYLAAFVQPHLPEDAVRPRRILAVLTVFFGTLVAWAIGALGVAAVKDHAGWA
jgi:capsular polysaccharide transport system permease protein